MRSILGHASKILFDTQLLLTPIPQQCTTHPTEPLFRKGSWLHWVGQGQENKEQKGKRKYHAGTPHPNDRGGFTQWFGSCSLMSTLYVWFPASWAPMVAERLFSWSPPSRGFAHPQHGRPASGPAQTTPRVHPWHQHSQGAAGSSEAMEETDSTEVKYKIRQWSLPGATIVPVLNVSSRVFWLELDDKALLDSCAVLQGILCDVFSQKCSAAWQGARGERPTVGIMLPGRQDADDWLNFMLSQKNLWPTFTIRGTLTEKISEQVFSKERRRLQARHLWMVVKLRWGVLADRMYVKVLLFARAARRNRTDPYEEKRYRGSGIKEVQAWWKKCQDWMAHFKEQSEPFVFDF